jgi:hypothetical protein
MKGTPEYWSQTVNRTAAFLAMCEVVGEDATPAQVQRLRDKAMSLYQPCDYDYPRRVAAMHGIELNLPE